MFLSLPEAFRVRLCRASFRPPRVGASLFSPPAERSFREGKAGFRCALGVARLPSPGFDGSVSTARLPLLGCSRPPCPPGIEPSGSGRAPERKGTPPGRASLRSGRSRVKGVRDWGRSGPGQRQNPATYWTPAPASAPAVVARALTASLSTDVQPDTWMAPSAVGVSVTRPVSGSR